MAMDLQHAAASATPPLDDMYGLVVYSVISVVLISVLLLAAWWLGEKTSSPAKELPYEAGVIPTGSVRIPLVVPFYLVAIFFIIFDIEAIFVFIWGVSWELLGWGGLVHISVFVVVLLLGLVWVWQKGGLEWGPFRKEGAGR